ncbi:hypothetical protein RN001_003611 [Aquatica leii]|uniref:5'-nucleotidase n=1 Tax=Aquatica leii TaxID=1421715 RepID=A0AAN7ST22_9COLE|nr:hypothetical protein RN001_003611 [Aquatica leii]
MGAGDPGINNNLPLTTVDELRTFNDLWLDDKYMTNMVKRPNMDRDRHLSSADRHRGKREHLSGSEKRKAAAEKEKKTQEVLAKSRRMTDFFTAPSKQSKAKSDVATTSHSLNDDTASRCASPLQEDDLVSADDCNNMVTEDAPATSTEESTEALEHLSDNICESFNLEKDIGLWPEILIPGTIDCCSKMDITSLQYCNEELFDKKSTPQFYTDTTALTFKKQINKISKEMVVNYIEEISELNNPKVHIKNKERVNSLIHDIISDGHSNLQIVSDFDRTITKQHENGKLHLSSFGMFSHCPSVPEDYLATEKQLTGKYFPIEIDPNISHEEKRKFMEEWWSKSENALKGLSVTQQEIEETAASLGPSLRNGCYELFRDLHEANVPVLVFSAGLGNSVLAVLKHFNVYLPNVKIISNFLKYNDDGVIEGFKGPTIHVLNKNEYALQGTQYYDLVRNRGNVILMGDSLGDAGMADGVAHARSILKIGFLYDHVQESLPGFLDTFDIVLEDDQTMDVISAILKRIF